MREIIFRAKTVCDGDWVYGGITWNPSKKEVFIHTEWDEGKVIPETVGQYTGLCDKNGTKIFENGYMIIDNKTYKVIFDNAEYILTNIFNCDIITLKNNSIKGVFVDEI